MEFDYLQIAASEERTVVSCYVRRFTAGLTVRHVAPYNIGWMRFIHLLSCGGTIEKVYLEHTGSVENLETKIDRYLERLRLPDTTVLPVRLMNKDSLMMTDADRQLVLDAVRDKLAQRNAPVVITHGTDTMVETGLCVQRTFASLDVPSDSDGCNDTARLREQRRIAESDGKPVCGACARARCLAGDAQSCVPHRQSAQGSFSGAVRVGGTDRT
jgi:hypothetical protein